MPNDMKRLPSFERRISEVSSKDIRVRIYGTIVDSQVDSITLDDGTGTVKVGIEQSVKADPGSKVRVIGRVIPFDAGVEIQAEIIQDMSGLDFDLLRKVQGLEAAK